jgi:hydrogenase nickel incorporation protein HypA/HybF
VHELSICQALLNQVAEIAAAEIACLCCGTHSRPPPNRLVCTGCGGFRTRVVAGEELRLRRVELQVPPQASAA